MFIMTYSWWVSCIQHSPLMFECEIKGILGVVRSFLVSPSVYVRRLVQQHTTE
jgi:hypothetical protein